MDGVASNPIFSPSNSLSIALPDQSIPCNTPEHEQFLKLREKYPLSAQATWNVYCYLSVVEKWPDLVIRDSEELELCYLVGRVHSREATPHRLILPLPSSHKLSFSIIARLFDVLSVELKAYPSARALPEKASGHGTSSAPQTSPSATKHESAPPFAVGLSAFGFEVDLGQPERDKDEPSASATSDGERPPKLAKGPAGQPLPVVTATQSSRSTDEVDEPIGQITLAIVDGDSTLVYYTIYDGVFAPDVESRQREMEEKQALDRVLAIAKVHAPATPDTAQKPKHDPSARGGSGGRRGKKGVPRGRGRGRGRGGGGKKWRGNRNRR